ncbi:hypothetical protein U2441_15740, partial [Listeria monocytogenes]|uniref:hypothetical protein n=1 Tax=Listeria monocytogenes TaxID=1639 RepID=UPI002FDBBE1B
NQFHWHLNLIDGGINQDVDMTNELLNSNKEDEKFIWETLKKYTSPNIKLRRLYVNAYTHGTDSLPHKDSMKHDEYTAIFY